MRISKALPIKFYLNGQTVFNDQSVPGVAQLPFLQKFNSTDDVIIQFYDSELNSYYLRCFDEDDVLIDELPFTYELLNGVYIFSIAFQFGSDFGVTNQPVKLKIVKVFYEVTGAINDTMETASGTLQFVDVASTFSITGSISDMMETGSGNLKNAQEGLFGLSASAPGSACSLGNTLYYAAGASWGTGTVMYYDSALSSAVTGYIYIANDNGEIFNINSGTGQVGSSTGIFC